MGLFSKEQCVLCGSEVGALKRTKIQNKEFVCIQCDNECSKYIDLYKLTKDDLIQHIDYMRRNQRLYNEVFLTAQKLDKRPLTPEEGGIVFCDELGMFQIIDKVTHFDRKMPELFRYDQVIGYETYEVPAQGKPGEFSEIGVKLTFAGKNNMRQINNPATHMHPFIEDEVKLCLDKDPKDKKVQHAQNTAIGIVGKFDIIFGTKDKKGGFFGGLSKDEKRQINAGSEMLNAGLSMFKAAKDMNAGQEIDEAALTEQLQTAENAANDANTGGLAQYTRNADEAERRVGIV